jgi:quercetin dioxygenase-like cupin family protein
MLARKEWKMQAYKWDTVAVEQLTDNIKRRMIVGTNEMLVRWEFIKGAVAARHSHPHEQIVVMVHGKLRLIVGDAETIMGNDDIVVIPPNTPHEAHALEDTVVIDIFSPPREDFLTGNRPTYLQ